MTLLHPPYTLWHLSYVAIGAALAPDLEVGAPRRGARGVLPRGRHRRARARRAERAPAADADLGPGARRRSRRVSIGGAVGIGVYASIAYTPWLAPLVVAGGFIVCAYNLELFGGAFHSDAWFALAWGAFPLLTAYLAVAERITRRRRSSRRSSPPF